MSRILLFTGKGGVGKTTCAAATAYRAAALGYRTLVLSSDPAHSLADALDVPLGPEPVPVAPRLHAQEIDLYYSMEKYWKNLRQLMLSVFRWQGVEEIAAEEMAALPGMNEGSVLLWLEADAMIREKSGGKRSLDDFLRRFHGGENSGAQVVPYTYDELVTALKEVADLDWRSHFDRRLQATGPEAAGAPLAGLEAQGWRLVYDERPNAAIANREERNEFRDWTYSLGLAVDEEGRIRDTVPEMPAARAGLAPGMTVVAVDGLRYSGERMDAALDRAKQDKQAIELLIENADHFRTVRVEHQGGRRYPHLERITGRPDLLSQTTAARAKGR